MQPEHTRQSTPPAPTDQRAAQESPSDGPPTAGAPTPPPAVPTNGEHVVDIQGVAHRFGEVVAINGISLAQPPATIMGLIGPSGSGKTTTIRVITGALLPERGEVTVLGENPRVFRRRTREKIGYMPQLFVLYPDLTARENIDFVAALFGLLGGARRQRVDEVLELVDLADAADRRASQLSGGMQRRLALACALVHQPILLILDEPTAGIDPLLRQRVWHELHRLRDAGVTLIVTTQYVTESEYCDSVALISTGELVALGTPDELRRKALGGEVIEVVTAHPFEARSLPPIDGVSQVRQTGPREMLVIAEDAGRAGPLVVDAVDDAGGDVESSREYRPSFDEVFTALVQAHAERDQPGGSPTVLGKLPTQPGRPR